MYAIVTKYYGPTLTRGSRVKATGGGRPSVSVPYDAHDNSEAAHLAARNAWIEKHCGPEHAYRKHNASLRWTTGELPDGSTVHVPWFDFKD